MSDFEAPPAMTEEHSAMLQDDLARSDVSGESAADWWARAHQRQHTFWLSGSEGPEVWNRLGVTDRLNAGATVLNVGVGLGICTRQLSQRGCKVSVLDISREALDAVGDVAVGYLASDIEALPSGVFDVALSHLVAQHMSDQDLEVQVRHVVRALKPNGVFAVQYALGEDGLVTEQASERYLKAGAIRRSVAGFNALVGRAGGICIETLEREHHPCGTVWRVAVIGHQPVKPRWWSVGSLIGKRA